MSQMMADTQAAMSYTYIEEDPKQYMAVLLQPLVMPKPPAMPTDSSKARALQPGLRGMRDQAKGSPKGLLHAWELLSSLHGSQQR